MTSRRVLRYEIPIDDMPHVVPEGKVVLLSAYRQAPITGKRNRVELWIETTLKSPNLMSEIEATRHVQIFGTGHALPEDAIHLASTLDGPLVWHLYRVTQTAQGAAS